jgi:hypothetical protein
MLAPGLSTTLQELRYIEEIKTLASLYRAQAEEAASADSFPEHSKRLEDKRIQLARSWHLINDRIATKEEVDPYLVKRVADSARDLVRFEWVLNKGGFPLTRLDESFFLMSYIPTRTATELPPLLERSRPLKLKVPVHFTPITLSAGESSEGFAKVDAFWRNHKALIVTALLCLSSDKARLFFSLNGGEPIPEANLASINKRKTETYPRILECLKSLKATLIGIEDPRALELRIHVNSIATVFEERLGRIA